VSLLIATLPANQASPALNQTVRPAFVVSPAFGKTDMDVSSAVMVLLMCSPSGGDCMEIKSERTYESAALCREALPETLARMNRAGHTVSGRCSMVEGVPPGVDPIVTCSTGHRTRPVLKAVRVTRLGDGEPVSDEWLVPREDRNRCG
jgi:hypothetical protein